MVPAACDLVRTEVLMIWRPTAGVTVMTLTDSVGTQSISRQRATPIGSEAAKSVKFNWPTSPAVGRMTPSKFTTEKLFVPGRAGLPKMNAMAVFAPLPPNVKRSVSST